MGSHFNPARAAEIKYEYAVDFIAVLLLVRGQSFTYDNRFTYISGFQPLSVRDPLELFSNLERPPSHFTFVSRRNEGIFTFNYDDTKTLAIHLFNI